MRVLVTGATGFLGRRLVAALERPVVLARDPAKAREALGPLDAFRWDAEAGPPPSEAFDGVDAVVHLAGEPVGAGRWTEARKARILRSREAGTRNLVAGMAGLSQRPPVLVSASAVGWYGPRGEEILDESSPPGDDFLARVCKAWEAEAARARDLGVRVVTARVGVVLGAGGGALTALLPLFRAGLGGPFGLGRAFLPWVSLDDVVALLLHGARTPGLDGPLNVVGPEPVRNRDFVRALGRAVHRPALLPVPPVALRLAVGEFADALLASQRVVPKVARETGYRWAHPALEDALAAAL
jgi:uncharacterized protein